MNWALIMAGGSGERFWPKSRKKSPKQLLPITSTKTMIQLTIQRLKGLINVENILILTNELQKEMMILQLPDIPANNIIAEPVGRDTAACIGLAATLINIKDKNANMIVLPADHVIHDHAQFQKDLQTCLNNVEETKCLMTIGIKPSHPATGYGYLKVQENNNNTQTLCEVEKFVEKPNTDKAEMFYKNGNYYWNSGMFIWNTQTILNEIEKQMPKLFLGLSKIKQDLNNASLEETLAKHFPNLEKKSIDYGVMENAQNVFLLKANFDWDDVGSWESIEKHFESDQNGNVCIGNVKTINCKNMLIYNLSHNNSLIATAIDLKNQILVQTDDAVLVCCKQSSQKVKQIVEIIKKEKLDNFL